MLALPIYQWLEKFLCLLHCGILLWWIWLIVDQYVSVSMHWIIMYSLVFVRRYLYPNGLCFCLVLAGLFVFPIYCLCKKKRKRPRTEMPWYEWTVVNLNGSNPARRTQNLCNTAMLCWLTETLKLQSWQRSGGEGALAAFLLHSTLLKAGQNASPVQCLNWMLKH